jgi:hypothetical protein
MARRPFARPGRRQLIGRRERSQNRATDWPCPVYRAGATKASAPVNQESSGSRVVASGFELPVFTFWLERHSARRSHRPSSPTGWLETASVSSSESIFGTGAESAGVGNRRRLGLPRRLRRGTRPSAARQELTSARAGGSHAQSLRRPQYRRVEIRFEITLVGAHVNILLNRRLVIENRSIPGIARSGPIGLQHHGNWNVPAGPAHPASSSSATFTSREL